MTMLSGEVEKGIRMSGGLQSLVAALVVTPSNAVRVFNTSPGKRSVIKKIKATNRGAVGNTFLRIGYETNAAIQVFVQTLPDLLLIQGIENIFEAGQIPLNGNTPEGFMADTTLVTGTDGDIYAGVVLAGAAPNDVQIEIECEEV